MIGYYCGTVVLSGYNGLLPNVAMGFYYSTHRESIIETKLFVMKKFYKGGGGALFNAFIFFLEKTVKHRLLQTLERWGSTFYETFP